MNRGIVRLAAISTLSAGLGLAVHAWAAPAPNSPQGLADASYAAMGFSDVYRGEGTQAREMLVTLRVRGTVQAWDPGESETLTDLMKPDWGTSTFVATWDRPKAALRTEWVRPRAAGGMRTYTEILTPAGGYVIGNSGNGAPPRRAVMGNNMTPMFPMSGLRSRALLREQERMFVVISMHEWAERLSEYPAQTVGGKRYPAVQYRGDNATFIVMFDPATKLPAIVRTRDFDQLMGDANFDMAITEWRDVNGIKLPAHMVHTLNGVKVFDTVWNDIALNASLAVDAFTVPLAIRGKAPPPAAAIGKVPYQWILRRLALSFYLDSDALYSDEGANIQLTDVAPNISMVTGATHNTLIVATNDSLIAFDSPADDGLSLRAIELAKAKYPGKPFKYLVLTHHHIDHTGGLRAYAAEGATLVVGKGSGAFFRRVLSAPTGLNPFPIKSVPPKVIEVDGKWSVNEGGRVIEAHSLENPHAAGYLIPYVPDAKIGFVTDLWSPGPMVPPANPNMTAVVRGLERAGVVPERMAGGHGAVANYSELVRVVGPAR